MRRSVLWTLVTGFILALSSAASSVEHRATTFYQGFDLSSLHIVEQGNVVYKDTARGNATRAAEDILGDGGMNTVRLRIWVNPTPGQYDLAYTLSQAQRFYN